MFGDFQGQAQKLWGFVLGHFDDYFRLVGIHSISVKNTPKSSVGLTKFQLPDDMCSDNQGKQAILSGFHHIM